MTQIALDKIRNFAIIAHIDHGKSTLADRFLEITKTISQRQMKDQHLDQLSLEREKGITIKLAPVSLEHEGYLLNLIDTPGHVDFSYEVSKSLQACEGVLLVVDASQGIQAQTLANVYLAFEHNLKIIPVLNKIDLPTAAIFENEAALKSLLPENEKSISVWPISAKTGQGVPELLQGVIDLIPPPAISLSQATTRALIFDSYYDDYRGVILYIRLFSGEIKTKDNILLMASKTTAQAVEVGQLRPQPCRQESLTAGQIGYLVTNLKSVAQARVGDTITLIKQPASSALAGYKPPQPFVFVGLFPAEADNYDGLKNALQKLALTDSALVIEPENSPVLGHGWRAGLLGLLHLEIVVERLWREYQVEVITSNPSAACQIVLSNGQVKVIKNANDLPLPTQIKETRELMVDGEIISQKDTLGSIIALISQVRGQQKNISYLANLVVVEFKAPLANLLVDFYDQLKSQTSGYGSLNYQLAGYESSDLVRLDFLIAQEPVSALSLICHRSESQSQARKIVNRLKEVIPRQQFKVAIQAAIGGKIIARADLSGYRKDVTAKLYGGDISRRKKLLQQQKKGKAKMKKIGKVDLPPAVFRVLLERSGDKDR